MQITERLISLVAPHECLECGREGHILCELCAAHLPPPVSRCYRCGEPAMSTNICSDCSLDSSIAAMWPAAEYVGVVKEIVHRLKFGRAQAAANDMAVVVAARVPKELPLTLITYVPTAHTRVRQRGYDQAALLAKAVARELGLPYAPLLARMGSARQVGASGMQRRRQLRGSFRPRSSRLAQNTYILLIDDVLTTGSTLESAARVLRSMGAAKVSAATFAQAS